MNARHLAFAAITLLGIPASHAQQLAPEPIRDPVLDALTKSIRPASAKPKEVPAVPAPTVKEEEPAPAAIPVPATDHPPEKTEPVSEAANPEPAPEAPAASTPQPRQGLAVRVEKLQTGTGSIDPSKVKLLDPFPAKPLAPPPAGWCFKSSENVPPFTREVELSPGNRITLTIRPHLLVPDADGANVFNVPEPGFDPLLGFHQSATVSAILSHSIRQLEEDSKELGATIDKLQQILVSLPKPEPPATRLAEPPLKPKPATPRKR